MTTYILHGGQTPRESANNDLFFKQFTESVEKDHVKILLCYWSRDKNNWNERFELDKSKIIKQSKKEVTIEIVDAPENLAAQLKEADVMFVSGGEEKFLRPYLPKMYFLKEALNNKIYMGSSMGAFLPSKHYVLSLHDQEMDKVLDGLNLIPYNVLCHWNIEEKKKQKIKMVKDIDPQTPILFLDEEKFTIIKI